MELGRSRRTLLMMLLLRPPRRRARAGFFSYGVIMARAALKDQQYRTPLALRAPNPRARGALGDQTDPLEPAGRRFGNFV